MSASEQPPVACASTAEQSEWNVAGRQAEEALQRSAAASAVASAARLARELPQSSMREAGSGQAYCHNKTVRRHAQWARTTKAEAGGSLRSRHPAEPSVYMLSEWASGGAPEERCMSRKAARVEGGA